ncbi:MAG: ComEA family DNA-binding protein [Actinobacteria bacterium]|jgi:competence protein ComEA|nr:ComEA family DNA-binding protein [Actinomycetota bacterium]
MQIRELKDNFLGFSSDQKKGLIAVSLVAITFSVFLFLTTRGSAIAQESPKPVLSISPIQSTILIHVAGKVKTPGVYPLLQGSRVADAIKAAGGALKGVDTSEINLARVLVDGEQIYVGYVSKLSATNPKSTKKFTGTININRATKPEFDSLAGIGPVIAARIITYRNQNGPFMAIEDLLKVSGVGPKTLEKIRSRLTL